MLLVREVMYCKPGKVRPMVDMFLAMNKLGAKVGMPPMRVMTDFCAERYWTIVAEMEVESLDAFERMMQGSGVSRVAAMRGSTAFFAPLTTTSPRSGVPPLISNASIP